MKIEEYIVKKFGTPVFVLERKKLINNFYTMYEAFNRYYPTVIAYSYKTNYLPYIC
ncbi:MAG: hypothetical protein GXO63_01695 [Candidatus Micrarchaeota archaeon]|nr:hypothetical protein [Candidatus Micrarchaeota archaeon]